MYGKGCSKGKGKGKDKGSAAGAWKEQGHLKPRSRLSAEKFAGSVTAWKGKYGWIQPGEEIEHPKASLRNGSLFVSLNDLVGVAGLTVGASVKFHIWEDESGLGAEEVVQLGAPPAGLRAPDAGKGKGAVKGAAKGWGAAMPATKGASFAKGAAKGAAVGAAKGAAKGWGAAGAAAWSSGWNQGGAASWTKVQPTISKWDSWSAPAGKGSKGWSDAGKGKGKLLVKGAGKGKGKYSAEGGKGHLLPRTRITAEKFIGTVTAWKGKYGWIQPNEEIEHPLAKKHSGGIFVGKDDVQGGVLTQGAQVEFHIWEDSSGLGAEEVIQF